MVRHGGYSCKCGRTFLHLPGGILGRVDDMLIVRGINVYPSTLADILHRFPAVAEYRVIVTRDGPMDKIALEVECPPESHKRHPGRTAHSPSFTYSHRAC